VRDGSPHMVKGYDGSLRVIYADGCFGLASLRIQTPVPIEPGPGGGACGGCSRVALPSTSIEEAPVVGSRACARALSQTTTVPMIAIPVLASTTQ
jgi:hypothetical protein